MIFSIPKFYILNTLFIVFMVKSPLQAAIYTVTNTLDAGQGSLRQALQDANNDTDASITIQFGIPGNGPHQIQPTTNLPAITAANVTIDGSTQQGFTGTPLIIINGNLNQYFNGYGLTIASPSHVTIKSLAINGFNALNNYGIYITQGAYHRIQGCYIGTDEMGMLAVPNTTGIQICNAPCNVTDTFIGGSTESERNIISGNSNIGVALVTGNNHSIQGCFIGVDATSENPIPNGIYGIYTINNPSQSMGSLTIGGYNNGEANNIAYNGRQGIFVTGSNYSNILISKNSIFNNEGNGIQLEIQGLESISQQAPVIINAEVYNSLLSKISTLLIKAIAPSTPLDATFTLEFFINKINRNADGIYEGERFIGTTTNVTAGEQVTAIFTAAAPIINPGVWVSATATSYNSTDSSLGNTSEFSPNAKIIRAQGKPNCTEYLLYEHEYEEKNNEHAPTILIQISK